MPASAQLDSSKVYLISGRVLKEMLDTIAALRPLTGLRSESIQIDKGDTVTSIEVTGIQGFSLKAVELCDDSGNTFTASILVK